MENSRSIEAIDPSTFDELLSAYPNVVPAELASLDTQRYEHIPKAIKKQDNPSFLTKDQVSTLVDWKLSHGKFRPTLKGLLQQNPDELVETTTKDGFEAYSISSESAKTSLNILTKLKGIGPATASLLLSVYDPATAPFFSDELFRWSFHQSGKGKGWDRDINYNLKEYLQLFEKVQELKERFQAEYKRDIAAVELEKVAYVLGKRGDKGSVDDFQKPENSGLKRKASMDEEASHKPPKLTTSGAAAKSEPMRPPKSRAGSRKSQRQSKKRSA